MFSKLSKFTLAKAALFQNTPIYVQFYITARCNLTCSQCNIIYSNADVEECSLDNIHRIADNFAKMGVAMVLLTGGEPFARKDLPQIIYAFESRGIHVRMQTNGYANEEKIIESIEAGGKDISISLDSINPLNQDKINGGFKNSWHKAIEAISTYTKYLPKESSFASLGCVMQRDNINDIVDVIKFGTDISWFTSLVPVHVSEYKHPQGFRTFDKTLKFKKEEYSIVDNLIEKVRSMRKEGYLLFDSDQYLDDIKRFVREEPIQWRNKNKGVCDSPNLYFALLPNGEFAPCCDYRIDTSLPAYDKEFIKKFNSKDFRKEVYSVTSNCNGCMYGSYPEMSISMRFMAAKLQRVQTFLTSPPPKNWPLSYDEIIQKANSITNKNAKENQI